LFVAIILYSSGCIAQEVSADTVRVNQYGQEVTFLSLNGESQEGILRFTSKDGSYSFWFDNRVQFDAAVFSNDVYNPIGNGTIIRRARFAAKAILWENWYGELDLDFAGSVVELKDAYIKYTFSSADANIKAGHFKESIGMETTTTSRYLTFMERSFISKLDASRHLGVQGNYWKDRYSLTGGVFFNTVGDSEDVFWTEEHNKDLGQDEGYSFTGRVVFRPIYKELQVLHLGVAGTYRTPKTTTEIPNSFRYSTRAHTSINRKKYLDTDDLVNVEDVNGINLELAGQYKSFMFQSEYKNLNVNRIDAPTANLNGFYAQAAYLLFGGHYNYNVAEGEFTRLTRGKKYGELEVAFRYDYADANDFAAEVYGGSAEGYTAGLNYYFNPNVKFMMNYSYINNDRYANGKGKLYVGYDEQGNLTKDPALVTAPQGEGGDDFGFMSFRIEIDF
jgi:phosphate-selective porin OprO/OprP